MNLNDPAAIQVLMTHERASSDARIFYATTLVLLVAGFCGVFMGAGATASNMTAGVTTIAVGVASWVGAAATGVLAGRSLCAKREAEKMLGLKAG